MSGWWLWEKGSARGANRFDDENIHLDRESVLDIRGYTDKPDEVIMWIRDAVLKDTPNEIETLKQSLQKLGNIALAWKLECEKRQKFIDAFNESLTEVCKVKNIKPKLLTKANETLKQYKEFVNASSK